MKKYTLQEIVDELMTNEEVSKLVISLEMNAQEVEENLQVLLTMVEDQESNLLYWTSLERNAKGELIRIKVLSPKGEEKEYLDNIVSRPFYNIDFEIANDFEKLPERKMLVSEFSKLRDENHTRGLYIWGDHGVGKTFMVKRFVKILAQAGHTVAFFPVYELSSIIKGNFKIKESLMEMMKKVDFLVLDDMGSEMISSFFRDEVLFNVLSYRTEFSKKTIFTSTYGIEKLAEIEAKTNGEKYREFDKANRLISQVKALSLSIQLKGKKWN